MYITKVATKLKANVLNTVSITLWFCLIPK